MKNYYLLAQAGFVLLTFLCYGLLLRELHRALQKCDFTDIKRKRIFQRTIIALVLWMMVTSGLSLSGFLSDFGTMPPRFLIVLVVPLVGILWVARTATATTIFRHIPTANVIRLQTFRLFVEVLLWLLFVDNLLPVQMTFEGRNFDVLSGLTAPVIAWMVHREKIGKTGIVIWNLLCLGLLINIVGTAILSLPTPFRVFMNEPANTIVADFPIVWLPAFLVPLAYGLHMVSWKQVSE